jgi:hypothetical protein
MEASNMPEPLEKPCHSKSGGEEGIQAAPVGKAVYACGPYVCVCKTELEWGDTWLTVKSCMKRAVHAAAKLLVEAYGWFGGKAIQLIKYKEYTP